MDPRETVAALMGAVQNGDVKTARSLLADDFQFSGPVPKPMNGGQWMGLTGSMKKAFPDLDYHFVIVGVDGNVVHLSTRLTGTHTATFNLKAVGMSEVPATGKTFSMEHQMTDATVRDNKVVSWAAQPTEGAGLAALLSQLGVDVPTN